MSYEIATAQMLESLGIDANSVERVMFQHGVGSPPTLTVWFTPNEEQLHRLVSDFVTVYELKVRDQ